MLSTKARRAAAEIDAAIAEGRTRDVIAIIDSYGLQRTEAQGVCRELDRLQTLDDNAELRFGPFDLAHVWKRDRAVA
jgi:hypothetical protein